jgi:coenzyme F420-reducing hydrogenase gamma subunit
MSAKPKIAFFDFTSCEGCQLTIVDLLQTHLGLLDLVEIVQFREAMSEKSDDYLIAFIEGSAPAPATRNGCAHPRAGCPVMRWARARISAESTP